MSDSSPKFEAAQAELDGLKKAGIAVDYPAQFEFCYESLGILDSKASSLLTFNGVGLASLAVWLASIPQSEPFHFVLDIAFLLFLVSCISCLWVVWLYWARAGDFARPADHPLEMLALRDRRTRRYRFSWYTSFSAVVVTLIAAIWHTIETGRSAFGGACGAGG